MSKLGKLIQNNSPYKSIVLEYSRLIRLCQISAELALDTIDTYHGCLTSSTLLELISVTANEGTPDLLKKLLIILTPNKFLAIRYIIEYIENSKPNMSSERFEKFEILWNFRMTSPIGSCDYRHILECFHSTLERERRYSEQNELLFLMIAMIVDNSDILMHVNAYTNTPDMSDCGSMQVLLSKIACYDRSLIFFRKIKAAGCRLSNLPKFYRRLVIVEFTYIRRSMHEMIEIVNYLIDDLVLPMELYPLYRLAIGRYGYDVELLNYLIDVGVRIPISHPKFSDMIYGRNNFDANDPIFTLLQNVFVEAECV